MSFFWNRVISNAELILESGIIIPISLISLGYTNYYYKSSILIWELFCIFLFGTVINLFSEFQRY